MKRLIFLFAATAILFLPGCDSTVRETVIYKVNEPVVMAASEFRNIAVRTTSPKEITSRGKICFYNGYLYICESGKGIHIIDNRNPSAPKATGFVELLGNADVAIRQGKLYADAYVDLLWFDLADPAQPQLLGRIEDMFKEAMPPIDNEYGYDYDLCTAATQKGDIIVGWNLKEHSREVEYQSGSTWWPWGGAELADGAYSSVASSDKSLMTNGANGSMSRFGLYKDYLYTVLNSTLSVIDLSGAEPVKAAEAIYVGDVETIFSYKENLFLGTPTGMTIYSVANPLEPERMSTVWHIFGCDPVVVDNDLAYVTVHSGNLCGQNVNELMIIDVSDVKEPKHLVTYSMTKPKGLGVDKGLLFLCDAGLKIYKIGDDPQQLLANRLAHFADMEGYDVIPYDDVLMMIADDGLYQYDYSNLESITQLSRISLGQ
jgi:hypothetical protein